MGSNLGGIWAVLPVPFRADGHWDRGGLEAVIEWVVRQGADGVVLFGLASEIHTLADHERSELLHMVGEAVAGRLPLVVGVEHSGTWVATRRAAEAAEAGAAAVMALPPYWVRTDTAGLVDYYRAIGAAANRPVIIQDAQPWTGVVLDLTTLARLRDGVPQFQAIKVESPPTGPKITALRREWPDLNILGGSGGLYAWDELQRGAAGLMVGPLHVRPLQALRTALQRGEHAAAERIYRQCLPGLVVAMSSLDTFIAAQKQGLQKLGLIHDPVCRAPHVPLDPFYQQWLEQWLWADLQPAASKALE